jgi:hypothetical protein
MADKPTRLERVKQLINHSLESVVSKTVGRLLLGQEVSGPHYVAGLDRGHSIRRVLADDTEMIETSLTLDYRKKAWGIERIVLDTVSNHLPADSKGTEISVEYLQAGEWVGFRRADHAKAVEAIRVKDDGKGYDYRLLDVLFSTKTNDAKSVGQFGEGLKLVASACLRKGIGIEYRSRDWSARPYSKTELIDGTEIQRLCFKVEKGKERIQGSETTFHNPNPELISEVNSLPDSVLAFNERHRVLYSDNNSPSYLNPVHSYVPKIIDLCNGQTAVFVKNIRVRKGMGIFGDAFGFGINIESRIRSLFSYDLSIDDISPDRQIASQDQARWQIKHLLDNCDNPDVINTILAAAHLHPDADYEEYEALNMEKTEERRKTARLGLNYHHDLFKHHNHFLDLEGNSIPMFNPDELLPGRKTWREAFYALFGEGIQDADKKVVLASGEMDADKDAEALGYRVVKMHRHILDFLKGVGVKTARDLLTSEKEYKWVAPEELMPAERELLGSIPDINRRVFGRDIPVNVRVYEGQYLVTRSAEGHNLRAGVKLETDNGFYLNHDPENPANDLIGIKRATLQDPREFRITYEHETTHKLTQAGDYDRGFAQRAFEIIDELAFGRKTD